MIHLLFLVISLGMVAIGQRLLKAILAQLKIGILRLSLTLLSLAMPLAVLAVFGVTMWPHVLFPANNHHEDMALHQDWLVGVSGTSAIALPVLITGLFGLARLGWLYGRMYNRTWLAPDNLYRRPGLKLRLWYSDRLFAFNLPCVRPGGRAIVVLSTALTNHLTPTELGAVIEHEIGHLLGHHFWVRWLAQWWQTAFFYLPTGAAFIRLLEEDQELTKDDRVARLGGPPAAFALSGALLKVWEGTLDQHSKPFSFRTLDLAGPDNSSLTEQRVRRLLDLSGQSNTRKSYVRNPPINRGLLTASVGLWVISLCLIHLAMSPLGCFVSP